MIFKEQWKSAIWDSKLSANAKILLLAVFIKINDQGVMVAVDSIKEVKRMASLNDEQFSEAIIEAIDSKFLVIDSVQDDNFPNIQHLIYVVRLPND